MRQVDPPEGIPARVFVGEGAAFGTRDTPSLEFVARCRVSVTFEVEFGPALTVDPEDFDDAPGIPGNPLGGVGIINTEGGLDSDGYIHGVVDIHSDETGEFDVASIEPLSLRDLDAGRITVAILDTARQDSEALAFRLARVDIALYGAFCSEW
jgi:hypothetical protein